MVVYLTGRAGFPLVAAGLGLAVYQVAAVSSRVVFGWIADRWVSPRVLLGVQGVVMADAAAVDGLFGEHWPPWTILTVLAVAGATAKGFPGLASADDAPHRGPAPLVTQAGRERGVHS